MDHPTKGGLTQAYKFLTMTPCAPKEKTITLKMADQGWSDIYVVFTKILCGRNFCVWYVTKLKFTGQLQMTSLSLHPQF